jgi:branched-chain amino acid transport system ATP-binding protein
VNLLEVSELDVYYGVCRALKGVSLTVAEGEIVTLIGANGAGKSTFLKALTGLVPVRSGEIRFRGQPIKAVPAHRRVALGIAMVPEGRGIFPNLTVRENLLLGAFLHRRAKGVQEQLEQIFARFPRLKERESQPGGTLSGGEQQMLAIGRALLSRPSLLLLDEPSMGLAPFLIPQIFSLIRQIREQGTTVLLIEQNANAALKLADQAFVLETGQITHAGRGSALLGNDEVRAAYLG